MIKKIIYVMLFIILVAVVVTPSGYSNRIFTFIPQIPSEEHYKLVYHWTYIYSKQYDIPTSIVEGLFYRETKWHSGNEKYNAFVIGDKTSKYKSYGPGQIKVATAKSVWKGQNIVVTEDKLLHDIQFNVETTCKILRIVYDDMNKYYKSDKNVWLATLSVYNMGHNTFLIKNNKRFNSYAYFVYNYKRR